MTTFCRDVASSLGLVLWTCESVHIGSVSGLIEIQLGEQFEEEDEITTTGEDWELPFAFGEPLKLDIEFEGDGEPELEIEVELSGRVEDGMPDLA